MYRYKLSVITINCNNWEGLKRTIESVVYQTNPDFEYIIIDGGSTDRSVAVIQENAAHIDYWVSEKDRGIYHAMNKGVAVANGEYCIFMNSGDIFYDKEVVARVYDDELVADIVTGILCWEVLKFPQKRFPPLSIRFSTFYSDTLKHQASFIKTSLLKAIPYDETFKIVSDWKFFMQALIEKNSSYEAIGVIIARSDSVGISSNETMRNQESQIVLSNMLPGRVLADYENSNKKSPALRSCILKFVRRYRRTNQLLDVYVCHKFRRRLKAFNEKSERR